ncbi:MAG: YbjN domain-containing protein, partial [Pseudomonadota bacterium]
MAAFEQDLLTDAVHPIDIVETLAERREWDFDRVADDQIAMAVEGSWQTYSLSLAWSAHDETLRLICTFEMQPPEEKLGELAVLLDKANDLIWTGCFNIWPEQGLMVFRYGLTLAGDTAPRNIASICSCVGASSPDKVSPYRNTISPCSCQILMHPFQIKSFALS